MTAGVIITFKNGEVLNVEGYESKVTEEIIKARNEGVTMIRMANANSMPRGEMFAFDPSEVVTIKQDPYGR